MEVFWRHIRGVWESFGGLTVYLVRVQRWLIQDGRNLCAFTTILTLSTLPVFLSLHLSPTAKTEPSGSSEANCAASVRPLKHTRAYVAIITTSGNTKYDLRHETLSPRLRTSYESASIGVIQPPLFGNIPIYCSTTLQVSQGYFRCVASTYTQIYILQLSVQSCVRISSTLDARIDGVAVKTHLDHYPW
jgi:hypothetical protein